ncbi:MAG: hypothetical protein FOGNACKC_05337 [Anaerolineae bacterium]|nr:hypothetical protein [Anaerolineae bacterium]
MTNIRHSPAANQKLATHPLAIAVLLAFIALAVIYSLVTPPFEAGDESRHYAVVKYIADTGQLPIQQPGEAQIHWSHEGNQPPLYYALAAALTGWINTGTWADVYWYNPHTTIGDPLRPDNKNIVIHPPGDGWPWRGAVLAVHLSRFLSIAMAAVTVAAAYAIALRLFCGNRWLAAGAMSITAFNPMFIFISASVNNDNAVIMFCTLTLLLLVRQNKEINRPAGYAALLGLLIGLGALSKLYAFGLLPLAVARLAWLAAKTSNTQHATRNTSYKSPTFWRRFLGWSATLTALFLLTAGWFYLRNALLYHGDIFALQVMRETAGQRQQVPSLATLRAEFEGFRIAYWALFGGVNILADPWIYPLLDWVSLAALIGLIAFTIYDLRFTIYDSSFVLRPSSSVLRPSSPLTVSALPFAVLLGWCLMMLAGFIGWNITQPAGQGRLMYPAIAAISALGLLGLIWWLPARARRFVAAAIGLVLFAFAAVTPLRTIAPAYARPPLLTEADLPADLRPVNFVYDDTIRLIGYKLQVETVHPAEHVPISLYWQVLRPPRLDYSVFIHLLGRQRQVIGQLDSYPGGGKWPTTLLRPGEIVADHYEVPIQPQAEFDHAPARLLIAAGLYDINEPGRPGKPAVNAAGQPVEPIIGAVKLVPWQWPAPLSGDEPVNFFDKATLTGWEIAPDQSAVTLSWQATGTFETDTTVFLQVWAADTNQYVTGFDGPPVQGDYPTSLWAPGEIIIDAHPLDLSPLPPGRYQLLAGLYNPATGERLPAFGPAGPLPDYAVNLGTLRVAP